MHEKRIAKKIGIQIIQFFLYRFKKPWDHGFTFSSFMFSSYLCIWYFLQLKPRCNCFILQTPCSVPGMAFKSSLPSIFLHPVYSIPPPQFIWKIHVFQQLFQLCPLFKNGAGVWTIHIFPAGILHLNFYLNSFVKFSSFHGSFEGATKTT